MGKISIEMGCGKSTVNVCGCLWCERQVLENDNEVSGEGTSSEPTLLLQMLEGLHELTG